MIGTIRMTWTGLESASEERATIEYSETGIRAVAQIEGGDSACRYALSVDADGRTSGVTLECGGRELRLERTDAGWSVDGERRPDLDAAVDVDITATPLTNALPIRRLGLRIGGAAEIETAWIVVPDLTVGVGRQRYTRVGPAAYCFESLDSDFRRTIRVDDEGFVLSYPGLFERVTGS